MLNKAASKGGKVKCLLLNINAYTEMMLNQNE